MKIDILTMEEAINDLLAGNNDVYVLIYGATSLTGAPKKENKKSTFMQCKNLGSFPLHDIQEAYQRGNIAFIKKVKES